MTSLDKRGFQEALLPGDFAKADYLGFRRIRFERMKIRFGLIYLAVVVIGAGYELYINHFTVNGIVNYLLTGFLYSSVIFIGFYIVVRIIQAVVGRVRHKEVHSAN